jgi:hypothetical protein
MQKEAGRDRDKEPLVRVDGDGVGSIDAGECVLKLIEQSRRAAVARVDVKPQIVTSAQLGDLVEWIDGAGAGGTDRRRTSSRNSSSDANKPIPSSPIVFEKSRRSSSRSMPGSTRRLSNPR